MKTTRLLGPPHTALAEVIKAGLGRFAHAGPGVTLSTSDNSDPNTNGRSYSAFAFQGQARRRTLSDRSSEPNYAASFNRDDAITTMKLKTCIGGGDAAGLNVPGQAIMRRATMRQRLSGCIGDKPAALIAETAQDMPHALGRPLREWYARAGDIGSGLVGGTAFVLRTVAGFDPAKPAQARRRAVPRR